MGKYFKIKSAVKKDKIMQKEHTPWNIIASKIYNSMVKPEAVPAALPAPEYVQDWIKVL